MGKDARSVPPLLPSPAAPIALLPMLKIRLPPRSGRPCPGSTLVPWLARAASVARGRIELEHGRESERRRRILEEEGNGDWGRRGATGLGRREAHGWLGFSPLLAFSRTRARTLAVSDELPQARTGPGVMHSECAAKGEKRNH